MRILFCSPEVAPFAKTGGLADVSWALPAELRSRGVRCDVVMPLYRSIKKSGLELEHTADISFLSGQGISRGRVFSHGSVFFIENDTYFNRDGYYSYQGRDFPDNLERYAFFSRACVELAAVLGDVDVIHCNDWQTALVPAYIHSLGIGDISSCYTIHNLAYQGIFSSALWPLLFLPYEYFSPDIMEYFGSINVMKAGIVFSDTVTTVSPSYAFEIRTPEFGVGLDGLLRSASHKLSGIANGIDTQVWDPSHDAGIAHPFNADDMSGKAVCKRDLQERLSLKKCDGPLLGLISRLVDQKGIDLVISVMDDLIALGAQVAILGSGDSRHEQDLLRLADRHAGDLAAVIGFDETLAHVIEAGSDFFLMPSRFEPCGLNQMISMRYGTLPIVTCVGGLKDTVTALGEGESPSGLRVKRPTPHDLLDAVRRACTLYYEQKELFSTIRRNAMQKDVGWGSSAVRYYSLYTKMINFRERQR